MQINSFNLTLINEHRQRCYGLKKVTYLTRTRISNNTVLYYRGIAIFLCYCLIYLSTTRAPLVLFCLSKRSEGRDFSMCEMAPTKKLLSLGEKWKLLTIRKRNIYQCGSSQNNLKSEKLKLRKLLKIRTIFIYNGSHDLKVKTFRLTKCTLSSFFSFEGEAIQY